MEKGTVKLEKGTLKPKQSILRVYCHDQQGPQDKLHKSLLEINFQNNPLLGNVHIGGGHPLVLFVIYRTVSFVRKATEDHAWPCHATRGPKH